MSRVHARTAIVAAALLLISSCTSGGTATESPSAPSTPSTTESVPTATVSTGGQFPAPGTAALAAGDAAALQAVLDDVIRRYKLAPENSGRGVTAAVVTDRWRWTGAAGVDGVGKKLEPRTELALASITKTFVAAEVVKLAGEGRVDLDKPLKDYVKHKLTDNGATVRQHLSMVSGVPNFTQADYEGMDKVFTSRPGKRWTPQEALSHYTGKVGEPGLYDYSNPDFILLGLLIEAVTHQPLTTVVRKDFITPAGLTRIAFQDAERPRPPVAFTRTPICPGPPDGYLPCRSVASAGVANAGMAADAMTTALWGYQLYGGRVLPPAQVTEMMAGLGEYGLGTMRFSQQFGIGEAYGHTGQTPGYSTVLVVVPDHRVSVALLLTEGQRDLSTTLTTLLTAVQKAL